MHWGHQHTHQIMTNNANGVISDIDGDMPLLVNDDDITDSDETNDIAVTASPF